MCQRASPQSATPEHRLLLGHSTSQKLPVRPECLPPSIQLPSMCKEDHLDMTSIQNFSEREIDHSRPCFIFSRIASIRFANSNLEADETIRRRTPRHADLYIDTSNSSTNRTPNSPRFDMPLDIDAVTAKLQCIPDGIQTPNMTPTADEFELSNQVDRDWEILRKWGLDDMEINQARRWEQTPLHESAEMIHMGMLSECATELSDSCVPASLSSLFDLYDKKMIEYCRRRNEESNFGKAQDRAQLAVRNLVAKLRLTGSTWNDVEIFKEATMGGQVTLNIVAEFCESKLRDIEKRCKKALKTTKKKAIQRSRQSRRIRKLSPLP